MASLWQLDVVHLLQVWLLRLHSKTYSAVFPTLLQLGFLPAYRILQFCHTHYSSAFVHAVPSLYPFNSLVSIPLS